MIPTVDQLKQISKQTKFTPHILSNMRSVIVALEKYGSHPKIKLDLPHRVTQYIAQLSHENGGFRYDKEIWGNTAAQQRYDVRTDLGNTPERDGDGKLYMGRTGIQLTGKANYTAFRDWVWANIDQSAPDFVKEPDKVNTDPWEGLVPLWFWSVGNRTGKSLNRYADLNDIEVITQIINGGLNGYVDRLNYYTRAALVFVNEGYHIGKTPAQLQSAVRTFQTHNNLTVDGESGPRTRAKLHDNLVKLAGSSLKDVGKVAPSPVTEKVEIPVAAKEVEKPGKDNTAIIVGTGSVIASSPLAKPALDTFGSLTPMVQMLLIAIAVAAFVYVFVIRNLMAKHTKEIRVDVERKANVGLSS